MQLVGLASSVFLLMVKSLFVLLKQRRICGFGFNNLVFSRILVNVEVRGMALRKKILGQPPPIATPSRTGMGWAHALLYMQP